MYIFCFLQACILKRVQKHSLEGDALNQSDSTIYYEDLLSCSENSLLMKVYKYIYIYIRYVLYIYLIYIAYIFICI